MGTIRKIGQGRQEGARVALKAVLWVYIGLCVAIAGVNYGYAPKAPPRTAAVINLVYQIYENEFKVLLILVCGALAWKAAGKRARMRRANIVGFGAAALVLHLAVPALAGNRDASYLFMPLPWSSTGFQLADPSSSFRAHQLLAWGGSGVAAAFAVFVALNAASLAGTLLLGRRWQCATVCPLNGFVAEIWDGALPLVGKGKVPGKKAAALLATSRWAFFAIAVSICAWWALRLAGLRLPGNPGAIARLETLKYLSLKLLACMAFWIAWSGRGYCHYCPAGTAAGLIGKLAGQRIASDKEKCVGCGKCSRACPMYLKVAEAASKGESLRDARCLGCGHCVDACPTGALRYETAFLRAVRGASRRTKAKG